MYYLLIYISWSYYKSSYTIYPHIYFPWCYLILIKNVVPFWPLYFAPSYCGLSLIQSYHLIPPHAIIILQFIHLPLIPSIIIHSDGHNGNHFPSLHQYSPPTHSPTLIPPNAIRILQLICHLPIMPPNIIHSDGHNGNHWEIYHGIHLYNSVSNSFFLFSHTFPLVPFQFLSTMHHFSSLSTPTAITLGDLLCHPPCAIIIHSLLASPSCILWSWLPHDIKPPLILISTTIHPQHHLSLLLQSHAKMPLLSPHHYIFLPIVPFVFTILMAIITAASPLYPLLLHRHINFKLCHSYPLCHHPTLCLPHTHLFAITISPKTQSCQ